MRSRGLRHLGRAAALGAVFCAAGCESEPEVEIRQGTAVDHGKALFQDPAIAGTSFNTYACASCHDEVPGQTGTLRTGAPMAGATQRPSYWGGKELDLLGAINHCAYYFMLRAEPFAREDEEARALYAYLESLTPSGGESPAAPFTVLIDIADLPAGDAARGAGVYDRACTLCHGPAHTGSGRLVERAPVLPEQTLEEHPEGEYSATDRRLVFVEKVRHGGFLGYSGQMPPFSLEALPDAELADLLAFLTLY